MPTTSVVAPDSFPSFGAAIKHLRLRAQLTQHDLALATGYNHAHLSRLEHNQRLPDSASLLALFVPALGLEHEPEWVARLVSLAASGRGESPARRAAAGSPAGDGPAGDIGTALEEVPALPRQLVTRPAALEQLRGLLAAERRVALYGLPGMGKTVLAAMLAREWRPTALARLSPAEPIFWLTITPGITASAEVVLRRLAHFLVARGHDSLRPLLRAAPGAGQARDSRAVPLEQQLALIGEALARQPALVCLDNAHHLAADPALLAMLRHLAAATPAHLLLISQEDLPGLGLAPMALNGLQPDEGRALIEQLGAELQPDEAERLLAKAAGSPMLLRLALGRLGRRPAPAGFIDALEAQPQVAAYLLETVLRDLSPAAERLARLLAVFRQPVSLHDETLVELAQSLEGPYDMAAALGELQRRLLVEHPAEASLGALVRDHLYARMALDPPRKRALHQAAAGWYEQSRGNLVEAAHHFTRAGQLQQAANVLVDQAEALRAQGRSSPAVEVLDEALARARARGQSANGLTRQLLGARANLLMFTLRSAEAEENFRAALALTGPDQPAVRASLAYRFASLLPLRGQYAEAIEICQSASAALGPADLFLQAHLAASESGPLRFMSRFDESASAARRALALGEQLAIGSPLQAAEIIARAHYTLGDVERIWGNRAAALGHLHSALAAARQAGLLRLAAITQGIIGGLLYDRMDLSGSTPARAAAVAGMQAMGDHYAAAYFLTHLASNLHALGQNDAALEKLDQAQADLEKIGDKQGVANAELVRATVLVTAGKLGLAEAAIRRALALTEATGNIRMQGFTLSKLALIQTVAGDLAGAEATALRAQALPVTAGDAMLRFELHNNLALAQLARGDLPAARGLLQTAPTEAAGALVETEYQLIAGWLALADGDSAAAMAAASAVAARSLANGDQLNAARAVRLSAAVALPPMFSQIPRLVWVAESELAG